MARKTELRRIRRALDLTLEALEGATGINASLLSLIERGRLLPTERQVAALEEYFGKPIATLLADAVTEAA